MGEVVGFRRKLQLETSKIITLYDLHSQGVKLLRWRLGRIPRTCQLAFANRGPDFHARQRTPGRPKRLEAQHRTREPFHCAMVLLDDIIDIFAVADDDRGLVRLVLVGNRRRIRATLIEGDFLRQSLSENGLT
jgi:hypothetical protein